MASRRPPYPSAFIRVDVHPVLPAADRPSTDHPRVAAFVRSQTEHLPLYKQEGLALFAGWLEEQAKLDEDDRQSASGRAKHPRSSLPSRSSEGGLRAVDILADVRREAQSSSSASAIKEGSSGPSRMRMADRMKGKDGAERKNKLVVAGARRQSKNDSHTSAPDPKPAQDAQDVPQASQQTDIVLTRKELARGYTSTSARPDSPPSAPHPRKRASESANPPTTRDTTDHKTHLKRRRLESLDARPDDDVPDRSQPSPPPRAKPIPKQSTTKANKATSASLAKPSPALKATKTKERPPSTSRPAPSSGKENHDDDAEERAVRLKERKHRRRAKAAILKPKPQASPTSSSSDESSVLSGSSASDSSDTDEDSRTKTRSVKRRRRAREDGASDRPSKRRKDGKDKKTGKKRKKEGRDLGSSLGMGLGIMDTFRADNVKGGAGRRLTLKRDLPKPGVFNKGRASSKVDANGKRSGSPVGVPDLVFSEVRFLSRPRPAPKPASTASANPTPPRRRTARPRSPQLSSPPRKSRPEPPKPAPVRQSAVEHEETASDDGGRRNGDRPIETVSRFFAASKPGAAIGQSKNRNQAKRAPSPLPPTRRRVEYSPSWPDTVEQEVHPTKVALENVPASLSHSDIRKPVARSVTSFHSRRTTEKQVPGSGTSGPHRSPTRPSSSHRSRHSSIDRLVPSGSRSGLFPLPVTRPSVDPPPQDGRRHRQRLIYDGNSSIVEVVVNHRPRNLWLNDPDLPRPGAEPRPDLSALGEEADVFRRTRYDPVVRPIGQQMQPDFGDEMDDLSDVPSEEEDGFFEDQASAYEQDDGMYDAHRWNDSDGQLLDEPEDGYFDTEEQARPDEPYRHRVAFQVLDQQDDYSDDLQSHPTPQSERTNEGDVEEDVQKAIGVGDDGQGLDDEMDWTGYWKPHRT